MYYIGVDGGGTKTLFSLYNAQGELIKQHTEGTCHYMQVGYEGLTHVISSGINVILNGIDEDVVVGLGLAGYGREATVRKNIEEAVYKAIPNYPYVLKNDAQIALKGALGGSDGILVIAGTGSIAISSFDGVDDRCGGWGYAIGDEGSAYWIAKKVILEFSKQSDGRAQQTKLYELVKEETGIQEDADLISHIIKTLGNKREEIAKLAMVCAKGAMANDEVCLNIYKDVAYEIAQMINVLSRKVNKKEILVSYTGGVWKGKKYMDATFAECLDANVKIIDPMYGPDFGAYLFARELVK